ncbi:MAG TPA: NPCBM/NEW2 domain-containing protein [Candidatus Paceibacterota bacterium]|nr:NPCBM/NEW2 domain-containing protein [Verrucomicrobiota bacterium]HSA12348.1 NPCBM/NEW2 domain-containing protein [Candidatus Paceibacterota bacterium]
MKLNLPAVFTGLVFATFVCQTPAAEPETVWLSSLDLTPIVQGWGQPQADKSVTGKPLSIGGKRFERGLGTHTDSIIRLQLNGGAEKFSAFVGVDDAATSDQATLSFRIIGDSKVLWRARGVKRGQPPRKVEVDLKGVKMLLLLADSRGSINFGHANWADAKFLVTGARPVIVGAPKEEAVILTPKPPRTPRINGARIFGVRPGHPFLFTIPATGDRPMTFAVDNLPAGLTVDSKTGQIQGRIEKPGTYRVTFRASNLLGDTWRPFKIVCGDTLALTPHMGWNSWYVWENHVTDKIMREAADAMVSSGMINHGYQYVNIDDCWSAKPGATDPTLIGEPRDEWGAVNSNPRFPNMKALTDYIHSKGLKAGIYTSPGPLTCAGHIGAYQHEAIDAQRFAEWGYDFLKYDWCSYRTVATNPSLTQLQWPYRAMGDLLRKQGRDIVLNLCQYGMGKVWEWGKEVGGHSWRTAGDLGGSFYGIPSALFRDGFDVYSGNELHKHGGPGGWNDPDYLLLGYLSNWKGQTVPTPLTPNEQYTHFSLWCLVAAPLIFSGDITRLDDFTLNILCNDEVIEVDQDPLGKPGRRVAIDGDLEVWARDMEDGSKAVGLFNRGEEPATVVAKWAELGLEGKRIVRDLWRQKDLGSCEGEFKAEVPRHGVVLVRLRAK